MVAKLNQVVAAEQGVKARATRRVTDLYQQLQKSQLFSGLTRVYRPRDEEGEQLPSESTRVQLRAETVLAEIGKAWTPLWDTVLTKDEANTEARADIVVDGVIIADSVPVTYLLFLEKQLTDLRTAVSKVPLLDPAEKWEWDEASDTWRTPVVETTRTKKVPRAHVLYEATDRHPAQVESYNEDIVVGYWGRTLYSGAVPAGRQRELLDRVDKLIIAVKHAREQANSIEAPARTIGEDLFRYLLRVM